MSSKQCYHLSNTIIDEDDVCVVLRDKRDEYKPINFYDLYPHLELEA